MTLKSELHSFAESDSITAYEPVEDRSHWMRVVFAVHAPLAIPLTVWTDLSLAVGRAVSLAELARLEELALVAEAREMALRYLRYRPRTAAEVVRHLSRKDVTADVAKQAVADLTADGWMSDERYAAEYHEAKQGTWSRAQIAYRLRERGVCDDLTRDTVDKSTAREAERVTAQRVADKYWRTHASVAVETRMVKLAVHLQRRGFPMDVIHAVLDEVRSDAGSSGDA